MLDISPALLLVTGLVFFILLILLNKILYKPLLKFMDNRNESIKRDLENAGRNTSEIPVMLRLILKKQIKLSLKRKLKQVRLEKHL